MGGNKLLVSRSNKKALPGTCQRIFDLVEPQRSMARRAAGGAHQLQRSALQLRCTWWARPWRMGTPEAGVALRKVPRT